MREAFKSVVSGEVKDGYGELRYGVAYKADSATRWNERPTIIHDLTGQPPTGPMQFKELPWKPSIHMPKRFSRITLEVVSVRVERVQEISEADCMAEGVREYEYEPTGDHPRMIGYVTDADGPDEYGTAAHHTPQEAFAKLWDSVNGPGAWDRNDWVWCVEFRPL